jgi:ribonuclease Z
MIGDVGETESLVPICRDADAVVVESTYLEQEGDMARQFGHLTAKRAAELALQAGAKQLYLTHISRRYRERDVLQEAQAVFPNTMVARDFDVYQVKHE